MQVQYSNWSTRIFEGFYESNLFNSDTEYYLNQCLQDDEHPEEYEIDFPAYTQDVARETVNILEDYCINEDGIIKSMTFAELYSPRYYNYETDKLIIDMDVDIVKLEQYIKENKEDFNQYLRDNFTSRSGFWSFIEDNYPAFLIQRKEEQDRTLQVMIEYYILLHIYDAKWEVLKHMDRCASEYHTAVYEMCNDLQYSHAREVKTEGA